MLTVTIPAIHPIHGDFSDCDGRYETKDAALKAYDAALRLWSYCLSEPSAVGFYGVSGRRIVKINTVAGECVSCAVFEWYAIRQNFYEFRGYVI